MQHDLLAIFEPWGHLRLKMRKRRASSSQDKDEKGEGLAGLLLFLAMTTLRGHPRLKTRMRRGRPSGVILV